MQVRVGGLGAPTAPPAPCPPLLPPPPLPPLTGPHTHHQVNGHPLVSLPSKTVHLQCVHLTPQDRVLYDRLERQAQEVISRHLTESTLAGGGV